MNTRKGNLLVTLLALPVIIAIAVTTVAQLPTAEVQIAGTCTVVPSETYSGYYIATIARPGGQETRIAGLASLPGMDYCDGQTEVLVSARFSNQPSVQCIAGFDAPWSLLEIQAIELFP